MWPGLRTPYSYLQNHLPNLTITRSKNFASTAHLPSHFHPLHLHQPEIRHHRPLHKKKPPTHLSSEYTFFSDTKENSSFLFSSFRTSMIDLSNW